MLKKLKYITVIVALIFLVVSCISTDNRLNEIRNMSIKAIVDSIAADHILANTTSVPIGVQSPSDQYYMYKELVDRASITELVSLTNHYSPYVRCCAFEALVERKYQNIDSIYISHYNDNTRFDINEGCMIFDMTVFEQFSRVLNLPLTKYKSLNIKNNYFQSIDSLILFNDYYNPNIREQLFYYIEPKYEFYTKIKYLALSGSSNNAIIALAKFKNTNDIEIINNNLNDINKRRYAIQAVINNPSPVYLNNLKSIFDKNVQNLDLNILDSIWYDLFQAFAVYPNSQESQEVFETIYLKMKTLEISDNYAYQQHYNYIGKPFIKAISKYPNKNFDKYKSQIKLDSKTKFEISIELERETN